MKTVVNHVLVMPDDPNLTQPVAVRIRTIGGDLMRHRLRKLLKSDQVVFIDRRLIDELSKDLAKEMEQYQDWVIELMELKCPEDFALFEELRSKLLLRPSEEKNNSVEYAELCFVCREIWRGMFNEAMQLGVVKEYQACWISNQKLSNEHQQLQRSFDKLNDANSKLWADYHNLCDEHKKIVQAVAEA